MWAVLCGVVKQNTRGLPQGRRLPDVRIHPERDGEIDSGAGARLSVARVVGLSIYPVLPLCIFSLGFRDVTMIPHIFRDVTMIPLRYGRIGRLEELARPVGERR